MKKLFYRTLWCKHCKKNRVHEVSKRNINPQHYLAPGSVIIESECVICEKSRVNVISASQLIELTSRSKTCLPDSKSLI